MKKLRIIFHYYRIYLVSGILGLIFGGIISSNAFGLDQVDLYDVWEIQVTNSKTYSNPFNFSEIELQATFTAPSGKQVNFFGFYDGDGAGGQSGNVWKLRFMPDEVGAWNYTYTWTDGTAGGSGNFTVSDTGLPGPLKIATDNPWYFMTFKGNPFHARPYDLHHFGPDGASSNPDFPDSSWDTASSVYIDVIQNKMIARGYNIAMVDSPSSTSFTRNWWWNNQKDIFDVAVWNDYEKILSYSLKNKVYIFPFDGMVAQSDKGMLSDVFIRYMVARFGAYASYMGYSPTWEWTEIWSASYVNNIMSKVYNWNPFPILLSAHDRSDPSFTGWMGFSMRQKQTRDIFTGNTRIGGNAGGVQPPFDYKPIIGSEDIWEMSSGNWGNPRNAIEVRRGAWGIQMAGVMPLYSEWNKWADNPGNMPGEPEVRRMFDFFYTKTRYRQYKQLNNLVSSSARQIASGISGQEYIVYDEDGGSITIDLTETSPSDNFSVLWFNPTNGNVHSGGNISGGASRTLTSPFSEDSVLLISNAPIDPIPPSPPTNLKVMQ